MYTYSGTQKREKSSQEKVRKVKKEMEATKTVRLEEETVAQQKRETL
jgi:hypothetical protein